jgi:hypothetical protein
MTDITDAVPRLREMNDALEERTRMRPDPDACDDAVLLAAEVRRLRSVIDAGDKLTDAEREAIDAAAHAAAQLYVGPEGVALAATLRGLLARLA